MRTLVLASALVACAPEAQIQVMELPFLVDSYPGNGSVVPLSQASPILLRFSKELAGSSGAEQHLTLEAIDTEGEATAALPIGSCAAGSDNLLLECPINGTLQADTRYRLTVGTGLSFATGEQLLSPHQRWFQTLPE